MEDKKFITPIEQKRSRNSWFGDGDKGGGGGGRQKRGLGPFCIEAFPGSLEWPQACWHGALKKHSQMTPHQMNNHPRRVGTEGLGKRKKKKAENFGPIGDP